MQLFIGGISKSLTYDDLYEHFSRYGHIQTLKIIDTYGFVTFERREDSYLALSAKHHVRGYDLILEEAHRKREERERDSYRDRDIPRDRDSHRDREDFRGKFSPRKSAERYGNSPVRRCDYCERCPVHGTRPRREVEHPGDKYKIVLMGIPHEVEEDDVKEFARSYGFDPVFVRITRNKKFGIIEFSNHEEKEEALRKLDSRELMGVVVQVREYKSGTDLRGDDDRVVKRSRYDDDYDKKRNNGKDRGDDDRRRYNDERRGYNDERRTNGSDERRLNDGDSRRIEEDKQSDNYDNEQDERAKNTDNCSNESMKDEVRVDTKEKDGVYDDL